LSAFPTNVNSLYHMAKTSDDFGSDVLASFIPDNRVAKEMVTVTVRMINDTGEVPIRVQDVVSITGVQIPILYRHFGSREGLIKACHVRRYVDDIAVMTNQIVTPLKKANSKTEFVAAIKGIIDRATSDSDRELRARMESVIGATYGRPDLAAAVAKLRRAASAQIEDAMRTAQAKGWINKKVKLDAFAEWLQAQMIDRYTLELEGKAKNSEGWDDIFRTSVLSVLGL